MKIYIITKYQEIDKQEKLIGCFTSEIKAIKFFNDNYIKELKNIKDTYSKAKINFEMFLTVYDEETQKVIKFINKPIK